MITFRIKKDAYGKIFNYDDCILLLSIIRTEKQIKIPFEILKWIRACEWISVWEEMFCS